MGFVWSGFGSRRWWGGGGDHRCGFSEKLPEASPISNRANTSQLQQTKAEPISNTGEEEGEKMGVKQSPRGREGLWGAGAVKFGFISPSPGLI